MTDQFTSLSPAAIRDIVTHIDQSLEVLAKQPEQLSASDKQIRKMLLSLQARLTDKLESFPDVER